MNDVTSKNGLMPIQVPTDRISKTREMSWKEIIDIISESAKYAVLYFAFGIRFSLWDGKFFHFHDDIDIESSLNYLQLARIFDKSRELKIWPAGDRWFCRILEGNAKAVNIYAENEKEAKFNAVEAKQILWGTRVSSVTEVPVSITLNGNFYPTVFWTTLTEDRGVELAVPLFEKYSIPEKVTHWRLAVQTYNYIDCLENGLASFVDCRFVDIIKTNPYMEN